MRYWIKTSPTLDSRWGGYWSPHGFNLYFVGSKAEAERTFANSFGQFYNDLDKSKMIVNVWGWVPPAMETFSSYVASRGGIDKLTDPDHTDATGTA